MGHDGGYIILTRSCFYFFVTHMAFLCIILHHLEFFTTSYNYFVQIVVSVAVVTLDITCFIQFMNFTPNICKSFYVYVSVCVASSCGGTTIL